MIMIITIIILIILMITGKKTFNSRNCFCSLWVLTVLIKYYGIEGMVPT